jgi:hypothetical protein
MGLRTRFNPGLPASSAAQVPLPPSLRRKWVQKPKFTRIRHFFLHFSTLWDQTAPVKDFFSP